MRGRGKSSNLRPGQTRTVSSYSQPTLELLGEVCINNASLDGRSWTAIWQVPMELRTDIHEMAKTFEPAASNLKEFFEKETWQLSYRYEKLNLSHKITTRAVKELSKQSPDFAKAWDTLLFSLSQLPIARQPSGIYPVLSSEERSKNHNHPLVRKTPKDGWWEWRLSANDSFDLLKRLKTEGVKGQLASGMVGILERSLPLFEPIYSSHQDTMLARRIWAGQLALRGYHITLASAQMSDEGLIKAVEKQCGNIYETTKDDFWRALPKTNKQGVLVASDKVPEVVTTYTW